MKVTHNRPHLVLIPGGKGVGSELEEGPITRLGLENRVQVMSSKVIACLILCKFALLISVLYYIFG